MLSLVTQSALMCVNRQDAVCAWYAAGMISAVDRRGLKIQGWRHRDVGTVKDHEVSFCSGIISLQHNETNFKVLEVMATEMRGSGNTIEITISPFSGYDSIRTAGNESMHPAQFIQDLFDENVAKGKQQFAIALKTRECTAIADRINSVIPSTERYSSNYLYARCTNSNRNTGYFGGDIDVGVSMQLSIILPMDKAEEFAAKLVDAIKGLRVSEQQR